MCHRATILVGLSPRRAPLCRLSRAAGMATLGAPNWLLAGQLIDDSRMGDANIAD